MNSRGYSIGRKAGVVATIAALAFLLVATAFAQSGNRTLATAQAELKARTETRAKAEQAVATKRRELEQVQKTLTDAQDAETRAQKAVSALAAIYAEGGK